MALGVPILKHFRVFFFFVLAVFDEILCSPVSSTAKVLHERNDAVLDLMDAPTSIGDRVSFCGKQGWMAVSTLRSTSLFLHERNDA